MRIDILTLFPDMLLSPLQESILKRAQQHGYLSIFLHQLRDYALDRHQITDDAPYGGGAGMVMKPEPVFHAVEALQSNVEIPAPVILLTPQGETFTQAKAQRLAQESRLIFICGHYEGFDERIREYLITDEISIGDYVLTGGELAAMVIIDAVARWIPGVLGTIDSAHRDSHATGLLEGPTYTRPAEFQGWEVPPVLRSGDHAAVNRWRREQAIKRTWERRPELLEDAALSPEERAYLETLQRPNDKPEGS